MSGTPVPGSGSGEKIPFLIIVTTLLCLVLVYTQESTKVRLLKHPTEAGNLFKVVSIKNSNSLFLGVGSLKMFFVFRQVAFCCR